MVLVSDSVKRVSVYLTSKPNQMQEVLMSENQVGSTETGPVVPEKTERDTVVSTPVTPAAPTQPAAEAAPAQKPAAKKTVAKKAAKKAVKKATKKAVKKGVSKKEAAVPVVAETPAPVAETPPVAPKKTKKVKKAKKAKKTKQPAVTAPATEAPSTETPAPKKAKGKKGKKGNWRKGRVWPVLPFSMYIQVQTKKPKALSVAIRKLLWKFTVRTRKSKKGAAKKA